MDRKDGALSGLRVVDLTDERAVYGAKLLADLGAEVVRPVPPGGEPLRARGPKLGDESLWYAFYGANRIESSGSPDEVRRLLEGADIALVCDGQVSAAGLDRRAIELANPGISIVTVSSFGTENPWQDYEAPDLVAGALAGVLATTGDVDTPPLKPFGELNFMVSGVYAAIAALAARYAALEGLAGAQHVAVPVHDCLASCLEHVFMFYWYGEQMQRPEGRVLPRRGSLHWSNAYAVMQAQRGSIMVTPAPDFDAQLAWLIEEDAHGDLIEPQYQVPENLALRIERTMTLLRQWVGKQDAESLFYRAQARHAPYGWVLPIERVADNPQLAARNWFTEVSIGGERVKAPGAPYRLAGTPWQAPSGSNARARVDALDWAPRAQAHAGPPAPGTDQRTVGPLSGLKVLDFTHVLAGPFATRTLGDMGADVVKVSSAERAVGSNDTSHPYYVMWNRNKRALALDMKHPEGRTLARALAEQADVVIDNFSVGVLDRWGIGFDAVSVASPKVIYVQMSGMGDEGPWAHFVTYAPTIHALAGLTHMTSVPGREDIGIGFSYNDHQAGLHGVVAVLAALEARRRSGRGQRIDISQFEVGVNFAGPALLDYFANGRAARPMGNNLPYEPAAPHGCYPCRPAGDDDAERWIAIAVTTDAAWQALARVLGNPKWTQAPALATASGRVSARAEIDAALARFTAGQEAYELMATLQAAGVPAGVVQDGADLCERDPALRARRFVQPIAEPHPEFGQTFAERLPLYFDATPCERFERVRQVGEDSAAVLADWLGLDEAEIERLSALHVLR